MEGFIHTQILSIKELKVSGASSKISEAVSTFQNCVCSTVMVVLFEQLIKGTNSTSPCTRPRVFLLAFLETNPCPTLYPTLCFWKQLRGRGSLIPRPWQAEMFYEVTHCAGYVLANARPHQLRWGDWEVEAACQVFG